MSTEAMAIPLFRPLGAQLKMWWDMTRPRVLLLVLFTGLPVLGMSPALAGAASSTLNAWYERDSDAHMARTRNRPLPASSVAPGQALGLGLVLTVVSTAVLYAVGGVLPAAVGIGTVAFYVLVYTVWLKPRTPQNIVIGGAAGATTPMIVEAALDGHVGVVSILLFLIVFLWTPPHFWAIAIFRKEEYAAAGFPMMPNVVGDRATRRLSIGYTLATLAVSLAPVPLGLLSPAYGLAAGAAGGWFLLAVIRSVVADERRVDWQVFRVSIVYLFVVFGAMLVDCAARSWLGPLPAPFGMWTPLF